MRTNIIGIATTVPQPELNPYVAELLAGAHEVIEASGREARIVDFANWEEAAVQLCGCERKFDGLLLLAPTLEASAACSLPASMPVVSVHANHALPGVVNLETSEEAGAFAMVLHMLKRGHRRILHVAGPQGRVGAERRLSGYLRAHAAARAKPHPGHVVHADFSTAAGRAAMGAWLDANRRRQLPHAVFAASDAIAVGCLQALAARGLRVPEDISLAGFDDTKEARESRLATVRQPLQQMGQRAVEIVLDLLAGVPASQAGKLVFPTEIVLSHSISAPRAEPLVVS